MQQEDIRVPNFLTRYYVAGENPFLSLNDLPLEEANQIKMAASDRYDWGGFYAQYDYLIHRREIEEWIRGQMRTMGGKAPEATPVYMFLGDVKHRFDKFGEDTAVLQIPVRDIDLSYVSFVWPDSMYEMLTDENGTFTGEGRRTNTPKVYLYHDLQEAVRQVAAYNAANEARGGQGPEACVEAQVWNREMLMDWYRAHGRGM